MNIVIKLMETDAEIRGKAYVHWKSWQASYSCLLDSAFLESRTLENCVSMAHRWAENTLIAKDGEKVIGFAAYGSCQDGDLRDAGEITALYLLAEYHAQGIGYRLLCEALDRLGECQRIVVWVMEGNERAIRFYERCGFQGDGKEKEIMLGSPRKEIRMILEISLPVS